LGPALDVSIVVPYYNPGDRLRRTVEQMVRVLEHDDESALGATTTSVDA
jgi:hypothetical protein